MSKTKDTVELAKKLMSIKSVTGRAREISRVFDVVERELVSGGMRVGRMTNDEVELLWAGTAGFGEGEVMLLGHVDVVAGADSLFAPVVKGERLLGRGAIDMKSQDAVMVNLMIKLAGGEKSVQLVLTSDEEVGGKRGANWFFQTQKVVPKVVVVPDGGSMLEMVTKQKGPGHWRITFPGKSSHGSRPWEGVNPIDKVCRLKQEIEGEFKMARTSNEWLPTVTITRVRVGESINQVPSQAEVMLDVRMTEPDQEKRLERVIEKCGGKVEKLHNLQNVCVQGENEVTRLWERVVKEKLAQPVRKVMSTGASDARFVPEKSTMIMAMPDGGGIHADDEWVDLASLNMFEAVLEEFIGRV